MADDPPYLKVGTQVRANYNGSSCPARIIHVFRVVKCKVTFNQDNKVDVLIDDLIKGNLQVGAVVEAKHPVKDTFLEATINTVQDYSFYKVVFDNGEVRSCRRSALCQQQSSL